MSSKPRDLLFSPAAQAMLDKVRHDDHVSYVELEAAAANAGLDVRGDMCITLGDDYPNVIQWMNLSKAFLDAFDEIRSLLIPRSCSYLVYFFDGSVPRMPVCRARSPAAARKYRSPHWLPVTFQAKL